MPSRFTLPHVDITARSTIQEYKGESANVQGQPRERIEHGRRIQQELRIALAAGENLKTRDERLPPAPGTFIEVELARGAQPDDIGLKSEGIRVGATKVDDANRRTISLFVPNHALPIIDQIIEEYLTGELTAKAQQPKNKKRVEAIDQIRTAHFGTRWTDPKPIPAETQEQLWWALWCYKDRLTHIQETCARLGVRIANRDRWAEFPEVTVLPVLTTRATVELMLFATDAIAELRFANDNPTFFIDEVQGDQHEWVDGLAERIVWPGMEAPAVCVLDTGVNRGHSLIEPALAPDDMHALNKDGWGVDDHDREGHGTSMAGMALHGDLTAILGDQSARTMTHRLESVKVLPPRGFDPNEPKSYGRLTQAAIVLPEIQAPERPRVYCMAVTNENVTGATASTWSAAIDQAAAGRMVADNDDSDDEDGKADTRPKRLIILSGGNVPAVGKAADRRPQDDFPIEDPAQAWNALTIGGYTDLIDVSDEGYADWGPLVQAGELSPHSRTSAIWRHGVSPIKPELVFEAGNRAINRTGTEIVTVDSLSLLTTGSDMTREPLVAFDATSAAAAQAARMAAQIVAEHPDYWPETVRAVMVHSAEWTQPMKDSIDNVGKRDRYGLVRRFGYGVPSLERALASAQNDLAMVAQAEIQPYRFKGGRQFNECHYYDLPIPADMLERLDNESVELKVTLSYFIDPNPGLSANVDSQRYQSHGLRFDLQRRNENARRFKLRANAFERGGSKTKLTHEPSDPRWVLGDDSISAGSLHCDIWRGPAIELLQRNLLCIKPVNGWCRKRADEGICNRRTRYALVVSMKTQSVEFDIHTPIEIAARIPIPVEVEISS